MPRFTVEERVEVWDRWQAGDAYRLIGRDLGRSACVDPAFVESWGGVRPEPSETVAAASVTDRTGGDLSRCGCRGFAADGGGSVGSCSLDDQPGVKARNGGRLQVSGSSC